MLETFIILSLLLLAAILAVGVRIMAVADDIKALQAQVAAALVSIAAQKAQAISPADAQAILTNEQANLASAQAIIGP